MMEPITLTMADDFTSYTAGLSDWECLLFGGSAENGVRWRPAKGEEPNWFWRGMQFLVFGNRWQYRPLG